MKKLLGYLVAACVCVAPLTGCSDTEKATSTTETTQEGADGKEVKTETTVERKTTTDQ